MIELIESLGFNREGTTNKYIKQDIGEIVYVHGYISIRAYKAGGMIPIFRGEVQDIDLMKEFIQSL